MIEAWVVFPIGIIIATIISAVGIGGGLLWMPLFIIFLKMTPESAVVTSLCIQTFGKGSGSIAYFRQGATDFRLAFFLLLVALPGVVFGAYLANTIQPSHMELILGILITMTALLFVSSNQMYATSGTSRIQIKKMYPYSWIVVVLSAGSGMMSTGISEWMIPILRGKLSLRMNNAIATCIFVTLGICVMAVPLHLMLGGRPDWFIVACAAPGVIIGGQIGPRITQKINERLLKETFIFLLTLIGVHLIYNSY